MSAQSSSLTTSIEVVQPEIETTIKHAETSLERFQENRDSTEDLQNCIDYLNQLRGIFVVIEVQGCILLCQEIVNLANEVPVGANADKNGLLTNLSNAIFILRRYTEYYYSKRKDYPELLLPIINEIRVARNNKPFLDSHFFEFNSEANIKIEVMLELEKSEPANFEQYARRLRHMYQVGLLDLIRDRNQTISLKLIERAALGCARLFLGEPLADLWSLLAFTAKVMHEKHMDVTTARKRLLMKIEKYAGEMVKVGRVVGSKAAPDSIYKDLIYILALSGDDSGNITTILEAYQADDLEIKETDLDRERRKLFGPGVDVLRSLSAALQEEMTHIKEKLDILERADQADADSLNYIAEHLERLSGTLKMLDLPKICAVCDQQNELITSWLERDQTASEIELLGVADAILTIEQAIKKFEQTGIQPDIEPHDPSKAVGLGPYYAEALIVVVEEAQAGLLLAKKAITTFIDSGGDRISLSNVGPVLDAIRGAMLMIEEKRIANIIVSATNCINTELYETEQMPEQTMLETLADGLSSVEYYIESMKFSDIPNSELLKLSEESLEAVGYAVA